MDQSSPIVIPVKLDEKTFKRFARFDMLTLRRQWVRPAVFSLILIGFAIVSLLIQKEQSGLLAAVLLTVGLGLPLVYLGSFLSQVNMQAERSRLGSGKRVYTVTLDGEGLTVHNDRKQEETLRLPWDKTQQAFRNPGCVYLYVTPIKAFLLPNGQANMPDQAVWDFLVQHMGADKCKERRKRR
ncbi:MAG: YcxB family protein [Clostridia bacterium]|nr:YcxB family protein [Clostridia bacterium]